MQLERFRWAEPDLELLKAKWEAGEPTPLIAASLGRKPAAVMHAAKRYKFRRPPKTIKEEALGSESWNRSMRQQDKAYVAALLKAGYIMTQSESKCNMAGSNR